jgi:hydroxymethylpyrimidine pyrophosphatase-like HAD family hydrolase
VGVEHHCGLNDILATAAHQPLGPIAPNITVVPTNADGITSDPVRILVNQPEAIEAIRSLCRSQLSDHCYAETYYEPDGTVHSLGVFSLQADKGVGLTLVLDRLDVKPAEAMAIGDNLNDLPMFRLVGLSVALANAPDGVKQEASIVAPSNDEEGVAWALRALVL